MKKIILLFILLFLGLGAIYYFIFLQDNSKLAEVVVEKSQETSFNVEANPKSEITETVKTSGGNFNKIDSLHYASGKVIVERIGENYKIKFADDFASANGPDLFVYLSAPQNFKNIAVGGLDTSKTINLGTLKNLNGSQEYLISKHDFENHNAAVVIWCKKFGVQFSRADLK